MADGYMRYYLASAAKPVPTSGLRSAFEQAFPLPDQILAAVSSQLESVLGGI
jgi:hypothetical protein